MGMQNMKKSLRGASALRGVQSMRAEAAEPSLADAIAQVADVNKAFTAFKEANDAAVKKADVVQTEKVDRISASVEDLQTAVDTTNAALAALQVGGAANDDDQTPEQRAHASAFNQFFRNGNEDGLGELQAKAALRTDSDPDGGYTVPVEMETTIDRSLTLVSSMRSVSRVIRISGSVYKKLYNLGGTNHGWVGEGEARPQTDASKLVALSFPAMELYSEPAATTRLLDDSSLDIAQWLGDEVSIAFAEGEGAAFISGTGNNQPYGYLSYGAVDDSAWQWGKLGFVSSGVSADISDDNNNGVDALLDLVYALKQGYRNNARWMMNRTVQGKVRKLKTVGDNPQYLWQPSAQAGQPALLSGHPVTDDDNMPNVGANATPIAFGDFRRGYLIIDRIGIRVLRDPYTAKPYVLFYTTKRVGGGVQDFEAIKLLKCVN